MTREARMTNFEPDSIHFQNFPMIFSHLEFGFHWALGIPTFVIIASERDLILAQFGSGALSGRGLLYLYRQSPPAGRTS